MAGSTTVVVRKLVTRVGMVVVVSVASSLQRVRYP